MRIKTVVDGTILALTLYTCLSAWLQAGSGVNQFNARLPKIVVKCEVSGPPPAATPSQEGGRPVAELCSELTFSQLCSHTTT